MAAGRRRRATARLAGQGGMAEALVGGAVGEVVRRHVARPGWLRRAAVDVVRPGADTSVGADLAGMFFFRVSGRGRDPKTEGCIYRHRGS